MARIPQYKEQKPHQINKKDIILGEKIIGTNLTSTYSFQTILEWLGLHGISTGVISVNGYTGVVTLVTSDIQDVQDVRFVTDLDIDLLGRFVIDGENLKLFDADEHVMTFVGRDAEHEVGIDMINPERFDIQVPATVATGQATITLQEERTDGLSIIAGNNKFMRFVTTIAAPFIEFYQKIRIFDIDDGDVTMEALVLDSTTKEVKKFPISGVGSMTSDVTASITVGGIDDGETVITGTTLTEFVNDLINPTQDPIMSLNSVGCTGVSSATVEVGTLYNTTLGSLYYPGNISSADAHPDIDLTGAATTHTFSGIGVDPNTGLVSKIIVYASNYWSVLQNYLEGTGLYYDSEGVESSIFDAYRVAGSVSDNSNVITGRYKYWWSIGSIPTDSAGVRALINYGFFPVSTFEITIPAFETLVAFYLPDTAGSVKVYLVESSNADITSTFTIVPMSVDDANGVAVGYDRYESTIGGIGYSESVTYKIVIT